MLATSEDRTTASAVLRVPFNMFAYTYSRQFALSASEVVGKNGRLFSVTRVLESQLCASEGTGLERLFSNSI